MTTSNGEQLSLDQLLDKRKSLYEKLDGTGNEMQRVGRHVAQLENYWDSLYDELMVIEQLINGELEDAG